MGQSTTDFFVLLLLLCLFGCFLGYLLFFLYINNFLSRGFVSFDAGFFFLALGNDSIHVFYAL